MSDELSVTWCDEPSTLEAFLRRDTGLFLYHLGDLDPFYAPYVRWAVATREGAAGPSIEAAVLLYEAVDPPVLLAIEERSPAALARILDAIWSELPAEVYAHVSTASVGALPPCEIESHGGYQKMLRVDRSGPSPGGDLRLLTERDLPRIASLLAVASPGHAFEARSLAHGVTLGVVEGSALVAMAGVHVVSRPLRVAALGNIATHPAHRGRGLGGRVTQAICAELAPIVDDIGLNVRRDNIAAIRCYARAGFVRVGDYEELTLRLPRP